MNLNSNQRISKLINHCSSEQKNDSVFGSVDTLPPDAIFFTKQAYLEDKDPRKINLGIGAYRDDNGNPKVLDIVRKVQIEMANDLSLNKEYLPIGGDKNFIKLSQELILGRNSKRLQNGYVAGVQALSGTGALRLLFEFISKNFPNATVFLTNPTWGNHKKVIRESGLKMDDFRYWNFERRGLDLDNFILDLRSKSKKGDIVLLHGCAHNPTGVDPTKEEWNRISEVISELGLITFFDCAYQGFATGDLENDAYAVRLFDSKGYNFFIAQSYAKNLGLYNDRIGCASIVCNNLKEANACNTQLCAIVRPMYSNPPNWGSTTVKRILGNNLNFNLWTKELSQMSGRIIDMRNKLRSKLEELQTPGTWNHITDQIGMFSFTGLTKNQVTSMIKKHHIYMLSNGRISMAGVSTKNVEYIANAINDVILNIKD